MYRFKILVSLTLAVLTAGVIYLGFSQYKTAQVIEGLKRPNYPNPVITTSSDPVLIANQSNIDSADPLASFQASLSSLLSRVDVLEQVTPQISTVTPLASTTVFHPQVIYLGSASTQKHQWTDTGVELTINTADYPNDVNAVFEAGLSVIGGEAWARLKNKTTGAVMSVTEVFNNTNIVTWKSSPSFKLHAGSYTYVVQLKSSSGEIANLSGARLRISR